ITASNRTSPTLATTWTQQPNPGTVFDSKGSTLLHDVNTDFVARNAINFHGSASVQGTTDDAHRILFATLGNDVSGVPAGTSVRALNESDFSIRLGGLATG